MGSFFKMMFASMLGFFLSYVILIIFFFVIVAAIVSAASGTEDINVSENSVLTLNLNYEIPEKTQYNPFQDFSLFGKFEPHVNLGLNDILKTIKHAKTDKNIRGIYLNSGGFPNGAVTAEEIRTALVDFRNSGKFVIAYAEVYSQKAYYVASASDKVYLNPSGELEFTGISASISFYKELLKKVGVEVQVFYDGRFKTATEPFRNDSMSTANKQMTAELINNVWNHYLSEIAASRKMSIEQLDSIAENLLVRNANAAKDQGLVDDVLFEDQVQDILADNLKLDHKKKISYISMNKYNSTAMLNEDIDFDSPKIAVVYAFGDIVDGKGDDDNIGSDNFRSILEKLRKDDNTKAVVLRVNSPGGSALASDVIWREVDLIRKVKPIVVSMGDYAASGGYFISCAASKIVAESNTLTGSIGVFGMYPNTQHLMEDKLGIYTDGVKTNHFADMGDLTRPVRDDERFIIQAGVDSIYKQFKSRVATGRHMDINVIDSIAQGRVWTGTQALQLGLVDTIGNLDVALAMAAQMIGSKTYRLVNYPEADNQMKQISDLFSDNEKLQSAIQNQLGVYADYFNTLLQLSQYTGVQARIPFVIEMN